MRGMIVVSFLVPFWLTSFGAALAQEYDYDTYALRLKTGLSVGIVAGADERQIASVNWFPSLTPVSLMAERSEVAAELYGEYRSQQIGGSLLTMLGIGLVLGSFFGWTNDEGYSETGLGLVIGGVVVGTVGSTMQNFAKDKLSRAIWEYNKTLTP